MVFICKKFWPKNPGAGMPVEVLKTALPEVLLFQPEVYGDRRGFFMETHHLKKYADRGLQARFVQDNCSRSGRHVLRGLHYQLNHPQAKFVFVISGAVFDVAVDIRRGSPTFGRWVGKVLSEENHYQMFIPEGFAHGFCVLSETADFMYKCTDFYDPEDDRGLLWSDATLNIAWPVTSPIVSAKDARLPELCAIPDTQLPVYRGR